MTTAITTSNFSREQIDTIKQTVARGANDAQLALFLQVCRSRNLDPFTKQVYYTPQGIIVSIDGLRAIAERTNCYAPGATRYEYDDQKNLVAAFVSVKKFVNGTWFDVEESAFYEEYRGSSPIWKKMPRVMLAKCAEARALRRAFSSDLSGLYAAEEMDQAQRDERPVERPVVVVQPQDDGIEFPTVSTVSAAYTAAVNAIAEASTLDALKRVAGNISAAKEHLSTQEQADLRTRYNARRQEVA
ncbi:MAG: phage recombination protein Bet [Actinomycetales bacterium]|nr:phage recombination protein Bet [Actinomycetales bacterium]